MVAPCDDLAGRRWSKRLAQVFLVSLRLAIGWHLLVQGWEKVHSVEVGATEAKPAWTSRGYLLEAQGPFASWFRKLAGDPDPLIHEYLRLPQSREQFAGELGMPAKVEALWDERFKQTIDRFQIGKAQRPLFDDFLKAQKKAFQAAPRPTPVSFPAGTVTAPLSISQQIQRFQKLRQDLRTLQEQEQPAFGAPVRVQQAAELKAEIARVQASLLRQIMDATAVYDAGLDVLTANVRAEDLPAEILATLAQPQGQIGPLGWALLQAGWAGVAPVRAPEKLPPLAASIPQAVPPGDFLPAADFVMRWGLLVSGVLLILGLFTRAACVAGGVLTLLIFVAHPPLPGVPDPARLLPGYTPYVNQTLIEALALFALAATRSGAWLGLDALWRFLPARQRKAAKQEPVAEEPSPLKTPGTTKHKRYTGA